MSRWVTDRLARVSEVAFGVAVVRDADSVVADGSFECEVHEVRDWWSLRSVYERVGRRRSVDAGPVVLLVRGDAAIKPLSWDIEQSAQIVLDVRLPGPAPVRRALADLVDDDAERAIPAVEDDLGDAASALLTAITGLPSRQLDRPGQLRLAARLAARGAPASVLELARTAVTDPAVVGLLDEPADASSLQAAWRSMLVEGSPWADVFEACRGELAELFAAGVLEPVVPEVPVPRWAAVGARVPDADERVASLLAVRPALPLDAAGWCALAAWWGDVRRFAAMATRTTRDHAWAVWSDIDASFLPWLLASYGTVLSSAARWPPALHRVAHHLARRIRDGETDRVLLVVLDGMGHAQWAHLRERTGLTVHESGSTFAMVPTYTTVSRQAIFAGDLPTSFPESLWSTAPEPRRWAALWAGEGMPVTAAPYHRVLGRFPLDRIDFGAARAMGVVVNAVDELMHTSELLGDAQLFANLDVWVDDGFLVDIVTRGHEAGFEVWLTADHGNLECTNGGSRNEGLGIEAAGKRLLRYPNATLRDASSVIGITWDSIPGLPPSAERLRFAPGRLAYTNNKLSISHGGLSLDEVIVPLVRVTP